MIIPATYELPLPLALACLAHGKAKPGVWLIGKAM